MKNKTIVIYGDYIYNIDRYIYESDEMFYYRINYITKKLNENKNEEKNKNIEDIIGESLIEEEKKFNKCKM